MPQKQKTLSEEVRMKYGKPREEPCPQQHHHHINQHLAQTTGRLHILWEVRDTCIINQTHAKSGQKLIMQNEDGSTYFVELADDLPLHKEEEDAQWLLPMEPDKWELNLVSNSNRSLSQKREREVINNLYYDESKQSVNLEHDDETEFGGKIKKRKTELNLIMTEEAGLHKPHPEP
ncbi:hypothetical protein PIB30_014813 [Stylosanthes scabra]|uniref:Uncharacterized protein n=1 Tax=Stylosanthes scabra TaxID=79078 RepID=A0ABU6Q7S0_9FABA|nr:hypothetical protein [Stylosanthes scabra]